MAGDNNCNLFSFFIYSHSAPSETEKRLAELEARLAELDVQDKAIRDEIAAVAEENANLQREYEKMIAEQKTSHDDEIRAHRRQLSDAASMKKYSEHSRNTATSNDRRSYGTPVAAH